MNINPTRMELNKLKKALKVSKEGHKLLKDKQDELIRKFLALIHDTNDIRIVVNKKIREFSIKGGLSSASFPNEMVENMFLTQETMITADIQSRKFMGIEIAKIDFEVLPIKPTSALISTPLLTKTENDMQDLLPMLLKLTESEKNCLILSKEIEKLRRRVNALEYMVIPVQEKQIKQITMRLGDVERENITRLIKVKDM